MNLDKFLITRKSYNNNPVTHTSFIGGKYFIPDEDYLQFQELYFKNLSNKNFLIERNSSLFKFYLDIDIQNDFLKKKVDKQFFELFEKILKDTISDKYLISTRENEESKFNKIHINFYDTPCSKEQALEFRENIIKKCENTLKNYTDNWVQIIDKSVYKNGGLRMYGSFKNELDTNAYQIYNPQTDTYPEITFEMFQKTCIRTKENNIYTRNENIILEPSEIELFIQENNDKMYNEPLIIEKINKVGETLICVSIQNKICPFVNREHKRTQENRNAKSPLYIVINKNGMSLRCHNEECKELKAPEKGIPLSEELQDLFGIENKFLIQSLSCTHYDVAKCIFEFYKGVFMTEGVKNNDEWYEFSGNRWIKSYRLWNEMSENFIKKYSKLEDESGIVNKLISSLKTVGYKSSVIKECAHIFNNSDPNFINKLDTNIKLVGFENGVLDLNKPVTFRQGQPSDCITLTTGIEYIPYNPSNSKIKEVELFFEQVFVDKSVRYYALQVIASCLLGGSDEHFHIWSGVGSNAKSTLIQLIEKTLGEYACKLPISLLTNKRSNSGNASPEVIRTKGKRFVSMQEPENGDDLKVGLLKELTGRDKIVARELYKNSVEFLPQFKIFLCCNDLPIISASDNGTWRRLRVVEFKSKFCDNPDKENPHEFAKDPLLYEKIETWPEAFMSILVKIFNETTIIKEPEEVLKFTNQYKHDNDLIQMFCDSELLENDKILTPFNDIWDQYIIWCRESSIKNLSKLEFKKQLKKKHKEHTKNKLKGFFLSLVNTNDFDD